MLAEPAIQGVLAFVQLPCGMCRFRVLNMFVRCVVRASLVLAVVGTPILAPFLAIVLLSGDRLSAAGAPPSAVMNVLPVVRD